MSANAFDATAPGAPSSPPPATPGEARRLDEVTTVVLAPNPSAMTLEGTNTYLLGERGHGEVVLVDPGPDLPAHRAALDAALLAADAEVAAVVLTHHHRDHAAAAGWAGEWGVPLHAWEPTLLPDGAGVALAATRAETLSRAGLDLDLVHTPGHASDHVCVRVRQTGAVLTGDHVLGRGTTVVAWPDGDMAAYMSSLRRLAGLDATRLDPGHGPSLADPAATVAAYLRHREERERQVLAAVAAGDRSAVQIVARLYTDVDPALHPAAERSVRAHLHRLVAEGRLSPRPERPSRARSDG